MPIKTFTSAPLSSSDMNTYLMNQAVITCTAATHPATPPTGMVIYETDTGKFKYWNGTIWDSFPGQTVAFSQGASTVTSVTTTEVVGTGAGLTLASVSLSSTRPYRVEIVGRIQATGGLNGIVKVRAATGTVTTSSTIIVSGGMNIVSGGVIDTVFTGLWTPASTGTWNLAVTAASGSAAGNTSWGPSGLNPTITIYAA